MIALILGKAKIYGAIALAVLVAGLYATLKIMGARIDKLQQVNKDLKDYAYTRKTLDKIDAPVDADSARARLRKANAKLAGRDKR